LDISHYYQAINESIQTLPKNSMLFKTEKQISEDGKRFTSWQFAKKAFITLLVTRVIWIVVNTVVYQKPFSFWTFCLDFVNEFTCPGISDLQEFTIGFYKTIIPLFGQYWYIPHIFFILFLNVAVNPMLRKLIYNWIFQKEKKE
jgi:hypothetical protein